MKVLIDAYVNQNFGDDLLIYELVNAFPDVEFSLFADPSYLNILSHPNNLTVLPEILPKRSDYFGRALNKALSFANRPKLQIQQFYSNHDFDVYLQYGGSIFMQVTKNSWINKIRDYRYILAHFKTSAILGCNFGPYDDEEFLQEHRNLFKIFDLVTFRDTYSYGLFRDLNNAVCAADIGLMVKQDSSERASCPQGYIAASPIDLSFRKDLSSFEGRYYEKFSNTLVELSKQQDLDIVLLSFCENEGDTRACQLIKSAICSLLPESRVSIATHRTVEGTLRILKGSNYLIASRFHAIMMGLAFRVPTLPVSYSKKIDQELDDLNFSGTRYSIEEYTAADSQVVISDFLENPGECGKFIYTADRHFAEFYKLLNNG